MFIRDTSSHRRVAEVQDLRTSEPHLGKHVNRFPLSTREHPSPSPFSPFFVGFRVSICPDLVQESRGEEEGKSRRQSTEKEMQEYLLLNYPQDVRNNLKKLIKMPRDEELQKSDHKSEEGARSKKKGNSQERRWRFDNYALTV